MKTLNHTIFRSYDIRGLVNSGLDETLAYNLGRALAEQAKTVGDVQKFVVGRDGRFSSPGLCDALVDGMRTQGFDVIFAGCIPSPLLYFASYHFKIPNAVMVTGSHNPPDYNGFKMILAGQTIFDDSIQQLKKRILAQDFSNDRKRGEFQQQLVAEPYLEHVKETHAQHSHKNFKLVVDAGNGVAGPVATSLYANLGHQLTPLFCDIDGRFPNHHPDPADPKNLATLISTVTESKADLGFAFDGDGDRLGLIDNKGRICWPDVQIMLFAKNVLNSLDRSQRSDHIVFDVKCSRRLAEIIRASGGTPVMAKTGHSHIKNTLKKLNAPLAGEMSGHIFFNDRWFGFDDALYSGVRILEMLGKLEVPLSSLIDELDLWQSTPELKIAVAEGEGPKIVNELIKTADFANAEISHIDGLRADFDDSWGLVRSSNTTPAIILRFEGKDENALERVVAQFSQQLRNVDQQLSIPDYRV